VEGEPSGRIRETVVKNMEQAEPVKKNQHCEFYLQIPGASNRGRGSERILHLF
jgi:hypothetical protein